MGRDYRPGGKAVEPGRVIDAGRQYLNNTYISYRGGIALIMVGFIKPLINRVGLIKPLVSKHLAKAKIQDISQYSNFTVRLNTALKQDRFSLFSRSTFDRKTKSEIWKSRATPFLRLVFWLSAISIILLFTASAREQINPYSIFWRIVAIILGCVSIGSWFGYNRLKHRPDSHSFEGLSEGTTDLEKARILIEWVQKTIESKKRIFIQDNASGNIYELTDVLLNARNNIMFLIGGGDYGKALGIAGYIPEGALLYLNDDEEDIFNNLESKLFPETKTDPELEKKTNTEFKSALLTEKTPLADDEKSKAKQRRIESAIKRDTYYEKSTPRTHDHKHLKTILNRHDMMKLFVDYSQTNEFKELVVKGNITRELWTKVFIFIYNNWDKWQAYRDTPNTNEAFSDTLFGADYLNIKRGSNHRNKFRLGKHREMSNFIIECYVIPISELGKAPQRDFFRDNIQG